MEQYNDWTVLEAKIARKGKRTMTVGLCRCKCGREVWRLLYTIRNGNSKSCHPCALLKSRGKYCGHKLVSVWEGMKQRCNNKNDTAYKYYGARGISIYQPWNDSVEVFIDWCLENGWREGLQLDRRDNDSGYNPENCRFISQQKNLRNSRVMKSNNTTGYRGVSKLNQKTGVRYKSSFIFLATIYRLGHYDTAEEAAEARDEFIVRFRIPAPLNFPRDDYKPEDVEDEFERSGVDMAAVAKEIAARKRPKSTNSHGIFKEKNKFRFSIPGSMSETGKKKRLSFDTEVKAAEARNKIIEDRNLNLRRS